MHARLLSMTTGALLLAGAATARADASYSRPIDDYTLGRVTTEIATHGKIDGIDGADLAKVVFKLDVFATSTNTTCPGVDVVVLNKTGHTVWAIEVSVAQTKASTHHTDTLHLPYLADGQMAKVRVSCIDDYRSEYDTTGIDLEVDAKGVQTVGAALAQLHDEHKDVMASSYGALAPTTPGDETLLEQALAEDDPAILKELVLAIAKTGTGTKELGDALAAAPQGTLATAVAQVFDKVPAATQAGIARALLASNLSDEWIAKLAPMVGRLCSGARADVAALWILARGDDGIPVDALRTKIRAACKLGPSDGAALATALQNGPADQIGPVLDAADDPIFEGAIAAWKRASAANDKDQPDDEPAGVTALDTYLRDTQDAKRFDRATGAIGAYARLTALVEVAKAPDNEALVHKAEWLRGAIDHSADPGHVAELLTEARLQDRIAAPQMATLEQATRGRSPERTRELLAKAAAANPVFEADEIGSDSGIDMGELAAFANKLGACDESIEQLRTCARAVAGFEHGALAKLVAQKPQIVKASLLTSGKRLADEATQDNLADLATDLKAAGITTSFVVDAACDKARHAYGVDPDDAIAPVAKIDPDARCIGELRDRATSAHRHAIWLGIFGILGLVLPLPAGGFLLRRRYRKLQSELPKAEAAAPSTDKLADRLGDRLARGLAAGIADATRALATTPAATVLAGAADPAILGALADTVRKSVHTGDAATLLVRKPDSAIYAVALPVRELRPQVVQRYLGAPWLAHVAAIQAAAGLPVLALIVACGPDASEATLDVGYTSTTGAGSTEPEALLDAKQARERGTNSFHHVIALSARTSEA